MAVGQLRLDDSDSDGSSIADTAAPMVCVTQVYPHTGVSTHRCVLRFNSRGSIQVYPSIHATPAGVACGARKRVLACLSEGVVSIARASWSSPASSAAVGKNGSQIGSTI
eukprot:scaffold9750_cov116-Isochrysis_galbana.AAC.6